MINLIVCIFAAVITLGLANLIVMHEENNRQKTKELNKTIKDSLKQTIVSYEALSSEVLLSASISALETSVTKLNNSLRQASLLKYKRINRMEKIRYAKHKKSTTDNKSSIRNGRII